VQAQASHARPQSLMAAHSHKRSNLTLNGPRLRTTPSPRARVILRFKDDSISMDTDQEYINLPYGYTEVTGTLCRPSPLLDRL
jgi:hypothetical protein